MGGVRRADGRQLPVLPPALRRPDAQAAAPGRGAGLRSRRCWSTRTTTRSTAARRRARWRRRSCASWRAMFGLPGDALGHLTVERHDRQPRGAVGRARAASRQGDRARRGRALHARAHVPGARRRGAARSPAERPGGSTSTRVEALCRDGRRRHGRASRPGRPALGAVDAVARGARAARALRRARSTSTPPTAASSRCSPTTPAARPGGAVPAIADCDSVVVDPHKHGLQPYGCGAVLFRDPSVGRFYKHDSPYTYFTSDELHLGEISLECSRAGAAAAALWLTLRRCRSSRSGSAGPRRRACAPRALGGADRGLRRARRCTAPELDILTYFPRGRARRAVDAAAQRMLERGDGRRTTRSSCRTLRVGADAFAARTRRSSATPTACGSCAAS